MYERLHSITTSDRGFTTSSPSWNKGKIKWNGAEDSAKALKEAKAEGVELRGEGLQDGMEERELPGGRTKAQGLREGAGRRGIRKG